MEQKKHGTAEYVEQENGRRKKISVNFMKSRMHIAQKHKIKIVKMLLVCLVWVEPGDEFATEEPVEFACEDPVNSDNCAGKMITPSKLLLSLLC